MFVWSTDYHVFLHENLLIHVYMVDQIDLGTEDRLVFCNASDLLAVVE